MPVCSTSRKGAKRRSWDGEAGKCLPEAERPRLRRWLLLDANNRWFHRAFLNECPCHAVCCLALRISARTGPALLRIGSFYLYTPYKWLVWVWMQGGTGDIRIKLPLLVGAGIVVGGAFASGALFFLLNLARTKALSKNTEDLHGSARWAPKSHIA